MIFQTFYLSPIGELTLACTDDHLIGLWINGQKYHSDTLDEKAIEKKDCPILDRSKNWLDRYFAGQRPDVSELPLAPIGKDFRQDVWKILCEIPYGEVITYGDIAKKIAQKRHQKSLSSQAVGGAVGHNPISIIIPCHRVVGAKGNLVGFSAGIQTKIKLLTLEGVDTSRFFIPKTGTAL